MNATTFGIFLSLVLAAPVLVAALLLVYPRVPERVIETLAVAQSMVLFAGTLGIALAFARQPLSQLEFTYAPLLVHDAYSWHPSFLLDRLSIAYAGLVATVYPAIVRFSLAQFHREPGAPRFWLLVTAFAAALVMTSFSGNIDVLYLGWEVVGVSSVMLIGFFIRQARGPHNALRTLVFYRIGDAALLGAAAWIHHAFPTAAFSHFSEDSVVATAPVVAVALLVATLAKSAQLPMSPWLHRAMEGPASSSAIFYGALSVHLGPFLLMRTAALWMPHTGVRVAMATIGLLTALYGTTVGRTRPDAKTALAFATMTQIGLIFVEVALGWHLLAIVHVWAHAGLRTWQFLRSSSLIQDLQENPLVSAGLRTRRRSGWEHLLPERLQRAVYLAAMRHFWIDAVEWQLVARPLLVVFTLVARFEVLVLGPVPGEETRR